MKSLPYWILSANNFKYSEPHKTAQDKDDIQAM